MDAVRLLVSSFDPRRQRKGGFRHIATTLSEENVVAVAELETTVQVWSIEPPSMVSAFETVLEFGGGRLALCTPPDRIVVVAGAWERHGVCGYEATTGERLWQRKDLKRVGPITPAGDGRLAAACFQDRSMQVLDVGTGTTVASVRGARGFWQSRHAPVGLALTLGHVALIDTEDWSTRWRTSVAGFTSNAAAFSRDAVLVSDVADISQGREPWSVYCLDLSGLGRWRYAAPRECSFLALGWNEASREWLAVQHHVNNSMLDTLLRWNSDGALLSSIPLGLVGEYAFLPSGRLLLTGEGRLLDTRTGDPIGRLAWRA
jgi:hypothetical protein